MTAGVRSNVAGGQQSWAARGSRHTYLVPVLATFVGLVLVLVLATYPRVGRR
jgi:hypothetical protein